MTRMHRMVRWLVVAVALAYAGTGVALAANPQNLDITVSIAATKSLSVGTTAYDFGAMSINASSVSATAIVVTNDSGALIETYTLQGANAASTGGGTTWTLAAVPDVDTYALAAQFSTARPSDVDGSWAADNLSTSPLTADSVVLGNGVGGESGAAVMPGAQRNLWFRLKTPTAVNDVTQRKATLTLAVQ